MKVYKDLKELSFRPLQGLPIINVVVKALNNDVKKFPSPTGVTYYKYDNLKLLIELNDNCFRPLQGLPIINKKLNRLNMKSMIVSVPYRGYLL